MSAPLLAGVLGAGAPELAGACAALAGGAGLVLVAGDTVLGSGPATRRAGRLARALAEHGLPAGAAGSVARLAVHDAGDALLAARLADAPAVLAVAGARDAVSEELLGCCATILVAAPEDDEVAALVLADLSALGHVARPVAPAGQVERAALRAGLPPAFARRRELREALGA